MVQLVAHTPAPMIWAFRLNRLLPIVLAWLFAASASQAATGSGESTVISVDTRFPIHLWAEAAGLTGLDGQLDAEPKGDGVANILKYAFNMDPAHVDTHHVTPTGSSGMPSPEIRYIDNQPRLHLIVIRRKGDDSLQYAIEFSDDALNWSSTPLLAPIETFSINSEWERVVFRDPDTAMNSGKRFARVGVAYNFNP